MKSTGVVRKVDELGRIVIPKELRKMMGINEKDPLEIYTEGDTIILKKYVPFCSFCGNSENLVVLEGKNICRDCANKLSEMIK